MKVHARVESPRLSFNTTGMAPVPTPVPSEAARLEFEGQILSGRFVNTCGRSKLVRMTEFTGSSWNLRGRWTNDTPASLRVSQGLGLRLSYRVSQRRGIYRF